jgi:predicted SprT family Zn-dependent metalloprotease
MGQQTYYERCANCQTCNMVIVDTQEGHNEREEYNCANCQQLLGTVSASRTPTVLTTDSSRCQS